ncbi:response regulator [uncultured Campylobacter sp.]|uniref:response regulator n=1 Tax=uncultured Campylobacter sp. TaxID=218934 RepID=UPI0026111108|nr:response regulator [uncultured Campylobacter sp.]
MKQINILAVDDDPINLKLIEVMLKKHPNIGTLTKAMNGLEALNIIDSDQKIDLILLDIVMPVMNGLELLDNLRSRGAKSSIPVIVLTTDETIRREAFNKGAYDFLTKPVFEKDLIAKINEVLPLIK